MTRLNKNEQRVLGVLIEKSLTQPGHYPLTMNAILAGANQKQNRDPVMELTEADVARALYSLEQKGLVEQRSPAIGARANRFAHCVVEKFHWDRREQAITAELLLRGRQTAGELRTRASRMTPLSDVGAVAGLLKDLAAHEPPFVEELPREPGRSANRFRHLLADAESAAAAIEDAPASPATDAHVETADFHERLTRLEARVDELSRIVEQLRSRAPSIDNP